MFQKKQGPDAASAPVASGRGGPKKPMPPKKKKASTPSAQPAWKGIAGQMMASKC